MADAPLCYCDRCAREVEAVHPWAGYVWLKRAWFAGLILLAALMPIIMSEITLLLPLAMIFAVAGGPVLALSSQISTCRECGAPLAANPRARPGSSQTR
jgi:hypothetical protein